MSRWVKKGLAFGPPPGLDWIRSHAALPTGLRVGDRWQVFCSGRDARGRAQIGSFQIDPERPSEIVAVTPAPHVGLGPLGAFDDSGVTSSCIVVHEGRIHLYYTGWTLGGTVPFHLAAGLAISDDGGATFRRVSRGPILDRNDVDPFLTASPWVLVERGLWRMWYVSGTAWALEGDRPKHRYHVRYAESRDGLHWERRGVVCIDYSGPGEHAIARPCVIKDADLYRMWYSHRGPAYRIGYAESWDGIAWQRKDAAAGIDVSPSGWDSEMVAYPWVFDHAGRRFMLYNGNDYGRTGIGLAELEP